MDPNIVLDKDVFEELKSRMLFFVSRINDPEMVLIISYHDILKVIINTPLPKDSRYSNYIEILSLILQIALHKYYESNSNVDNWISKWDNATEEQKDELLFYEVATDIVFIAYRNFDLFNFYHLQKEKMEHIYETADKFDISQKINNILNLFRNLPPDKIDLRFLNRLTYAF